MKSTPTKFIVFSVIVVALVIGLGILTNKPAGPSKYDDFAKALKDRGAEFFGAFWCPHCQAEKALFGSAKQYLPYIECSNPDQTQIQICIDNKIESYPTWRFKDGISLTSAGQPTICDVAPGKEGEEAICKSIASKYFKTWLFPEYKFSIKSATAPTHVGNVWKFDPQALTNGEVPLESLAEQIGFTLPQ